MPIPSLIATIIVLLFLVVFLYAGFHKGFLRILFTTFSTLIIIFLSSVITRPLAGFLQTNTFVGPAVETRIEEYITSRLDESVTEQVIGAEDEFVDSLVLPSFLKTDLKENNTLNNYISLGVQSFAEYISVKLTSIVMYAISFVLLMFVISIVFKLIVFALKIISKIPVIRGINRLLGAVIGLVEGVLILWCICIFIMIFQGTEFGSSCMQVIGASPVLSFIYNHNLPVIFFSHFFGI